MANDADLAAAREISPKKRALGVPWGVVPVFRARGLPAGRSNADQPWYLCATDCRPRRARSGVGTPIGAPAADSASVPLEMSTVGELVAAMKKPSTTNFRRVVLVPSKQVLARKGTPRLSSLCLDATRVVGNLRNTAKEIAPFFV